MTVTVQVNPEPSVKARVYSNPLARKIVDLMLRSPRTPVTPEITNTDEISYQQLESATQLATGQIESLLSEMVEAAVIVRDVLDKVPVCPECGSKQLSTRYLCPKCFSYDIYRSYLYEHLKCGKVASDEAFRKLDQIICPKCHTTLHSFGVEYRAVGAWYKCNKCNESFNVPSHAHFCRPRRHQFTSDRTRLMPVYQYRLNPDSLSEIRRELLTFSDSVLMLEDLGLTVFAPHNLPDKSGGTASFDIVVQVKGRWGSQKTYAIDVVTIEGGVIAENVRQFAAKVRETKPSESYLLAVPCLTEEAKATALSLKVVCIEGATVREATSALIERTFKDIRRD